MAAKVADQLLSGHQETLHTRHKSIPPDFQSYLKE